MSDFDPTDFICPAPTTSRDEIYRHRARVISEEVRRGVEAEEQQSARRRALAQSRADAAVPTLNLFGTTLRVDHPYVQQYALTGSMLPETKQQLQAMVQEQNTRNLKILERDYSDVFRNRTAARLAAIHVQEIRSRDAAQGIVRPDGIVFREGAEATRNHMRGRKGR